MPGLRLLLRFAPFLVGAVAAAVWLRRRRGARLGLAAAPASRALEASPGGSRGRTGRFDRRPPAEPPTQDESIDIVTVVDGLLQAGR
jgi:hypothetical protein